MPGPVPTELMSPTLSLPPFHVNGHHEFCPRQGNDARGPTRAQPRAQPDHPVASLHLLGGFELFQDGKALRVGPTSQRLLALLACHGGVGTRRQVSHLLWPELTAARSYANLRTALYRARSIVSGIIFSDHHQVWLNSRVAIDLVVVSELADRLVQEPDEGMPLIQSTSGLAALDEDLLPEWDDDWLEERRFRYRQLRLDALEALSRQLSCGGHHSGAIQAALVAVSADPMRETAHETLIQACLEQGNRHAAISHYQRYCRVMRDELGLDPPRDLDRMLWKRVAHSHGHPSAGVRSHV